MTWAQRLKRLIQIDIPSGPIGHRTQSMGRLGCVLARRPRIDVMVGPVRTAMQFPVAETFAPAPGDSRVGPALSRSFGSEAWVQPDGRERNSGR